MLLPRQREEITLALEDSQRSYLWVGDGGGVVLIAGGIVAPCRRVLHHPMRVELHPRDPSV
ncbi:hypothetical protein Taro_011875 [Colocasia esculenta]|uniref:Uncharacterized protein n=1 Tax=Colocasia esculenta TaxID=4460 RepID=A0A843UBX9_COLES|nr:hypothetical protein [Colocasia esculenta]